MKRIKCISALLTVLFLFCVGTVDAQIKTLSANQPIEKVQKTERKAAPNAKKSTVSIKKSTTNTNTIQLASKQCEMRSMYRKNGVMVQSSTRSVSKKTVGKRAQSTNETQTQGNTIVLSANVADEKALNPNVLAKAKMLRAQNPEAYSKFKASPTNRKYVEAIEN